MNRAEAVGLAGSLVGHCRGHDVHWSRLLPVLFVTDLFHPIHNFSVELFLNGDVGHGRGRRGPMPVLFAGREPHHITGMNLLDRSAITLSPTTAGRDDERLAERMRVPCSPRARLECYAGALNKRWIRRLKQRTDAYRACEPFGGSLGEGCDRIRLISITGSSVFEAAREAGRILCLARRS
jgi:hypothetical protein